MYNRKTQNLLTPHNNYFIWNMDFMIVVYNDDNVEVTQ